MTNFTDSINLPKGFRPAAEQKKAYEFIENSKQSMFISGRAGTGKSTFIEYIKKNTQKKYLVLTFTGLAAVLNKGKTIHSFFVQSSERSFTDGFMYDGDIFENNYFLHSLLTHY